MSAGLKHSLRRILVTGASRGLGLALCRRLLDDDYALVTSARTVSPELQELARSHPERLEFYPADLADPSGIAGLVKAARLLDGLDGLVANAAVGTEGLLTLTSDAELLRCVHVNLVAPMLLAREAIKGMLNHGGSLIFIASVAGRAGFSGLSVYAATKGGLVSFSRTLAREYGERGIRSNCILPGFLHTEMTASLHAEQRERLVRRSAVKRLGQPEDVVGAVRFLLSDEARYITGTELVVDGGLTA